MKWIKILDIVESYDKWILIFFLKRYLLILFCDEFNKLVRQVFIGKQYWNPTLKISFRFEYEFN